MEQLGTQRQGKAQVFEEFGHYVLERRLGEGAMGEVWEATDRRTNRKVALKRLASHMVKDEDGRKRFEREARLASRLRDPHLVPIHGYGEIDGRFYVDMQLVEGRDLEKVLRADGALPPQRAVAIIEQIAHALATAHKAGLVHRDVKPSNILITEGHDGSDIAYLADFGISRSLEADAHTRTSSAMVVGTLAYMAPEQFEGNATRQSDLYALGCVLFECLTGSPPYPVDNIVNAIAAHKWGEVPRVSERAPWLSPSLDGVVYRALQKEPSERQVSVMDFARASKVALGGAEFFRDVAVTKTNGRKRSRRSLRVVRRPERKPTKATEPGATLYTDAAWAARPAPVAPHRKAVLIGSAIATAVLLLVATVVVAVSLNRPSTADLAGPGGTIAPELRPQQPPGPVSTALPRIVNTLAVPDRPETVAVSPDGRFAYMTSSGTDEGKVHTIDTTTNTVVATTPIPGEPRFVATNPTTGNVYVSYNDEEADKLEIAGIDANTHQIVKTIETGQPADRSYGQTYLFIFAISQDGKRIYIPHHNKTVVSVLDTDRNVPIAQIPMPMNPHSVALTPDGKHALVATHMSGEVDVVDTTTNTFVNSIPIGPGMSPHDVDISPDGRTAHVVNFDGGTVSVIDIPSNRVTATIPVGGNPQSVVFAADGRRSYVIDNKANVLHTIDATTNKITGTVPVTPGASMVALSPDGTRAYVASRDSSTITTLLTAA